MGLLCKARASRDTRAGNWGRLRSRSRRLVQADFDSSHPHFVSRLGTRAPGCTLLDAAGCRGSQASLAATDDRPSMRPRPSSRLAFGLLPLPASGPGMAFATWDSPGRPGRNVLLEWTGGNRHHDQHGEQRCERERIAERRGSFPSSRSAQVHFCHATGPEI